MKYYFSRLFFVFALLFISCQDEVKTSFEITFTPLEHDFGNIEVNQLVSKRVRIKNTENSTEGFIGELKIIDSPDFTLDFKGILTLDKNESKDVYVTFYPKVAGNFSAKLVATNDYVLSEMFLYGVGKSPVSFVSSVAGLDFGLIQPGESKDLDITFSNSATSGFDLELGFSLPAGDFSILGSLSSLLVAPGSNEAITIRYAPTTSNASKTLKVSHNSSTQSSPAQIPLSGIMDISSTIITNIGLGWTHFEDNKYAESVSSFTGAMNAAFNRSVYDSLYTESMQGMGWAMLFEGNPNIDYAANAYGYASQAIADNTLSVKTQNDALALATISGVLTLGASSSHYNYIIAAATSLLKEKPNWVFTRKVTVDNRDVRMGLVQAYFTLSDYLNAAAQMDILDSTNAPHSTDPATLLSAIQVLSGSL